MPFPQQNQSVLLQWANAYRALATTPQTALVGDVILYTPTGASVLNIPVGVAVGSLITVVVLAAYVVTIKCTTGTLINNVDGATGVALPTGNATYGVSATLEFDGTSWWILNH